MRARHAAQAPRRPDRAPAARRARGALRTAAAVAATGALTVLASLGVWSVLPALAGWHVDVVMSGSMVPAIRPGDLVLSEPVDSSAMHPGQVALFEAPDGRVLVHRVRAVTKDGTLTTRGDANPSDDLAPVDAGHVLGLARLRVPWIGLPVVWFTRGTWPPLAATALAAVAAVAAVSTEVDESRRGRHRKGARHLSLATA